MKTNYLAKYSKKVTMHQEGGPMPMDQTSQEQPIPASNAPSNDLQSMLMEAFEKQDPQLALKVVNAIVEQMQSGQSGQSAPNEQMPAAKKGMRMPQPLFRKGGELITK